MRLKRVISIILFVPILVLANESGHHDVSMVHSDFFYRVLNFGIFAGILYYLIANPIKEFFKGRSQKIANQIKEIEAKLQESKKEEELAKEKLSLSQEKAKEIIEDAKMEAKVLVENIEKKNSELLNSLEKHLEDKMEVEKKKVIKNSIKEILEKGIDSNDIAIDSSKIVSLISKKVA
jgi:F-type H+-transporting ATPase subunit b